MKDDLRKRIEAHTSPSGDQQPKQAEAAVQDLLNELNVGTIRAASRENGTWKAHRWVKEGILLGFKIGTLSDYSTERFPFFDKHTYPLKPLTKADGVRVVPGGSAVRTGSHLASGVVCMPPMYVNVGAYVDEGTMIDSHVLVGSCAQIGKNVHLSAGVQIGGVLEPVGAMPVVVEDDTFIGGGCGLFEGCIIRRSAVLASGVYLTASTRLYDLVHEEVIEGSATTPLEVPERAVVVPGTRPASTDFARAHGLSLYAPMIVKYRDEKTAAATALEGALR